MSKPVLESYLSTQILKTYNFKIGDFYFFENFIVVEYAENIVVSMDVLQTIKKIVMQHFPNNKPFGIIVNKIHPFNTVPTDAMKLEKEAPNLVVTAVVSEDFTQTVNFDLENHFFKQINRRLFSNLEEAEKWVNEKIETKKGSLN
ncbi:hypothetical protein DI383_10755 [Flavobacteriaceae bacterium LYZ1037]|nr:hypothetical protein DI383_10755 [Flavobacteriaceae bacterium LYZ1037]